VEAQKIQIIMDPNTLISTIEVHSEVENTLGHHDLTIPEQIHNIVYPEYIEDEWDNISGDIILFV
jgi:hypothetical protein